MAILAVGLALLALEALARIGESVAQDFARVPKTKSSNKSWSLDAPDVGWVRRPNFEGTEAKMPRSFDAHGYMTCDTAQVASDSPAKIAFVGDSNTAGYGVPQADSFVEVVDRLLPEVDAINLGVSGYSSFQGRVIFEKEIPKLDPKIVIVSFNFNDRRYVGAPDSAEAFRRRYKESSERLLFRLNQRLEAFCLYRVLHGLLLRDDSSERVPALESLVPRVSPAAYRENLIWFANKARAMRLPLIFLILGDNPCQAEHLKTGIRHMESLNLSGAIAELRAAAMSEDMFSDLARLYLAQVYGAIGDSSNQARILAEAKPRNWEHGGRLMRLDTEYHEIMREVAQSQGVEVVDATTLLDEDPSVYIDFCHFNAEGHRKVGKLLSDRISRLLSRPVPATASHAP
jgi:lysophospholipase L1-like esterase